MNEKLIGKTTVNSRNDISLMTPNMILILEELEEIRDGIESLLKADGYRVSSARDENHAVSEARRVKPDLILVSRGAPANLMITKARRIRKRAGLTEGVPIVIFSVDTLPEGADIESRAGIYLTRPDNFDQLRQFLRRVLEPHDSAI
jgi:DNA-binding response OmpR family regulator